MTEQAAVVWCVLNRVDAGQGDIIEVTTKPWQFQGWDEENPVDEEFLELVRDVLERWDSTGTEEGRVLPQDYLYFIGKNGHNYFTMEYLGTDYWDWSLQSPYEN